MKKKIEVKDIIGFEGLYKITSEGKVIKLARKQKTNGGYMDIPDTVLTISGRIGYPTVSLSKDGKQHTFMMHRLMAIHFIENDNPLIKNCVHHKNRIITDFSIENLEWCTRSENMKYANRRNRK